MLRIFEIERLPLEIFSKKKYSATFELEIPSFYNLRHSICSRVSLELRLLVGCNFSAAVKSRARINIKRQLERRNPSKAISLKGWPLDPS